MPHKISHTFRLAAAACLALLLLSALAALLPAAALTAASAQAGGTLFVRKISLKANNLVYSPLTNMLYASVPSSAGAGGNSITPINPLTGEVGAPVFIGSDPSRLALSDDGSTLYVYLSGAYSLRRFDVRTQTPGAQFVIGESSSQVPYIINDVAVAPGEPGVVAVARYGMGMSPPEVGVAIFDNGVRRPKTGPGHTVGSDFVAYSASASKLYGGGYSDNLRTMTIDETGVASTTYASARVGGRIEFAGGLVYGSDGNVMNPDTGALLGTFPGAASYNFVPDVAAGRVYYLVSENFGSFSVTLNAYDINTFALVGSHTIATPGGGAPGGLVRWGANGLAFRASSDEIYIIQTSLIPSDSPIPTPTPTPAATPTPSPTPTAVHVRRFYLPSNSMAYNAARRELYATLPSTAGASGNSVARINTATGAVESTIFVGNEPLRMAFSDDGQTMYVHLKGDSAVRRVDLRTQTAGLQFPAGVGSFGPHWASLAVMPGAADTVAVGHGDGDTALYDNGVRRPQRGAGPALRDGISGDLLHFGVSATRLYSGDMAIHKLAVGPAGLSPAGRLVAVNGGASTYFDKARGLLFISGGSVIDPEARTHVGTFSGGDTGRMAVDSAAGRVYFLSRNSFDYRWKLVAYDINTFLPVGFADLPIAANEAADLVRWGDRGLAFRINFSCCGAGAESIVLVETDLISAPQPLRTGVGLTSDAAAAQESDAALTVNVTRTGDLSGPTTVTYTTSDYTAAAGSDYTAASGTLDFAPGETTRSFQVAIRQDNVYEGGEAFTVTLSNPRGGALLTAPASALVTINDDEPPPSVSIGDVRVVERDAGTSAAQFLVSLSGPSALTTSVSYATADGTATAPADFVAASGTLTLPALTTSALIRVNVNGDTQVEPDETFTVNLSTPLNSSLGRAQATGTIVNNDGPPLQFSPAFYEAGEGGGQVTLTVRRAGDLSASASVNYTTGGGTASETSDYNLTLGTLRFAPGEAEKSFAVLVTDDALVEPDETFLVTLSSPFGGSLGAASVATVTLHSDDATPGPNPLDAAAFFVRQHYQDFLNREPDPSGLQFWTNEIEQCGADAQCREVRRNNVSGAFFLSIEFQETGYFAYRTYKAAYGNLPGKPVPVRLREFLADTREISQGVQVNVGDWRGQLEANKNAFAASFVSRAEFAAQYPGSLTAAQFVDSLNSNAGGALSQAERDALVADVSTGAKTRAQALRAVAEDPDLARAEFNRAFVLMQYFGYLRRVPDAAPDTDYTGYEFWLRKLDQFGGDFIQAEMVKAFINSDEYRKRFGQ